VSAARVEICLPGWLEQRLETLPRVPDRTSRMRLAVQLAAENVARGTGGPFGALVADPRTGQVLSLGVNVVVATGNCTAHAEMVALQLAEASVGSLALTSAGGFELVTSVEPCTMCLGAVVWSGVSTLVCGARDEDARAVGFDEGPKPLQWVEQLASRGISVVLDLCREESRAVLRDYAEHGGTIYGARLLSAT
jgi:tRNA(Arg) A34 adenosine deaminase TadA